MNCPYDKTTLMIGVLGANRKLEEYEKKNGEGSAKKKFEEYSYLFVPETNTDVNKAVAESNGITVGQLINSPNYSTLKNEHAFMMVRKAMNVLKEEFGLDDKEAWGMMMHEQLE